jgi:hypothetical protein
VRVGGVTMSHDSTRLLIVGNSDRIHVGAHLLSAANALGVTARMCDIREAYQGHLWRRKLAWWSDRRPARLAEFSALVVSTVREWEPTCVLSTGIAPIDRASLEILGQRGVRRLNFLTDDPWNPAHRAMWFFESLPLYDQVFSPRTANLDQLVSLGVPCVRYLPFGYAPDQHYVESPDRAGDDAQISADVMFAGGADADRMKAIAPFVEAGFDLALYGGYWDRTRQTRKFARGHAEPAQLRRAVANAKVCLCLVRRANRDGHSMRTFEMPAMGGCLLVEDTTEHRTIFGDEDHAVVYFKSDAEAVSHTRALVADPARRRRLATAAHALVASGHHTYADRLQTMVEAVH